VAGTIGLALSAEGITNAGIEDIQCASQKIGEIASDVREIASNVAEDLSKPRQGAGRHQRERQPAGRGV
ncbi:MAG TPA: hypothetical protein VFA18_03315, partial [Gemmataceae bacterium]|nr:hypothetical protein [Gemmataceae bacterium]